MYPKRPKIGPNRSKSSQINNKSAQDLFEVANAGVYVNLKQVLVVVAETQTGLQKKQVLYWNKGEKGREEGRKLQQKTNSKSIHPKTNRIQIHENQFISTPNVPKATQIDPNQSKSTQINKKNCPNR